MIVCFYSGGNGFNRNASNTCAVASISSISGVTRTNIRSFGVHACGIHVTRVISFTLVNICKMINIKEKNKFKKMQLRRSCRAQAQKPQSSFLGSQTQALHFSAHQIFSWFPASLNPLVCPVSPSIKSPFASGDFFTTIQLCHYQHCLQASVHSSLLLYKVYW